MWTPDAYQGAPTLVTRYMSSGLKAGRLPRWYASSSRRSNRCAQVGCPSSPPIAGVTMILGTVVGVAQTSVKRMLAYSSIAHAGYLLVGLVAANSAGKAAILFYLVAYAVTNLGAFGVLAALSTADSGRTTTFATSPGCGTEKPGLAALLTIFLLSLGGLSAHRGDSSASGNIFLAPPCRSISSRWPCSACWYKRGVSLLFNQDTRLTPLANNHLNDR